MVGRVFNGNGITLTGDGVVSLIGGVQRSHSGCAELKLEEPHAIRAHPLPESRAHD
jgi:hypothetical protein